MSKFEIGQRVCLVRRYYGTVVATVGIGPTVQWDRAGVSQASEWEEVQPEEMLDPDRLFDREETEPDLFSK